MRNAASTVTHYLWAFAILLLSVPAFAQETVPVSGTVLTEKGDPLPAVTVLATSRSINQILLQLLPTKAVCFVFPD